MSSEVPLAPRNPYWNFHAEWTQDVKDVGKWMLFYPKDRMEEKWNLFCKLRDEGKLGGVQRMKCSTGLYNPRASSQDDGVIILYCCNSSDKDAILETGKCLIPYLQDYLSERIYYKTDIQTSAGTIATGAVYNHTNSLQIPRQFLDDD